MRLGATHFHAVSSPSAVAIRENIVTEEPGLEDSGNTLLSGTPAFPVRVPGRVWHQRLRRAKYLFEEVLRLDMQFNLPEHRVPQLYMGAWLALANCFFTYIYGHITPCPPPRNS